MEKSIESIWKEGFLNSNEFIAPKVNNLYSKKSEHIVDKFHRMFKINLIAIVVGSFFMMWMAWAVDIPYMGVGLFVLANMLAFINSKLLKGLDKIDKNVNSYHYLKTFDSWLKEMISYNQKFARVFYPFAILSVAAGFWFGSFGGDIPGDLLVMELKNSFPEMILLFGFPLYLVLGLLLLLAVLAVSAGRIYSWDLNLVYGRLFKKLDEILADMEELRV
jgi:hypothetical protein